MRVRLGSLVVAVLVVAATVGADAQSPAKPVRVGVLSGGQAKPNPGVDAFREALASFGWVEGRNVTLDVRFADGNVDRLPALAAELVRLEPHVIVAASSTVARAVHEVTAKIPIVMVGVGDPIGLGFARSLRAPGGNMTGLASLLPELSSKSLQLLRELVPDLTRVAVLMNPTNPLHEPSLRETETAAATLGIHVVPVRAREAGELAGAFAAMVRAHADAVEIYGDAMFVRQRARVAELALSSRLPAMCRLRTEVEAGALVAYGPDYVDLYRRAAGFVDRILKGARPGELPIEEPTRLELILNRTTAKALGLTIPPSLLLRADQVID